MGFTRVFQISGSDQRRHHAWNIFYLLIRIRCPRQRGPFVSCSRNSLWIIYCCSRYSAPFVFVANNNGSLCFVLLK